MIGINEMKKKLLPNKSNSAEIGIVQASRMLGVNYFTFRDWVDARKVEATATVGVRQLKRWSLEDIEKLKTRIYNPSK
jgi:hypothetical protein